MKNFHFKTRGLRPIAVVFEAVDTCLKGITTASFCSADTSEKVFVEDFELDVIDIEEIKDETAAVDGFCLEAGSVVIVNDLKTVVDNFDERSDFLFCLVAVENRMILLVESSMMKSLSNSVTVFC